MFRIVEPGPEDREQWEDLFAAYNAFYGRSRTAYDEAWAAFQRGDRIRALVAREEDRVLGLAHFLTHASTTSADVCYLQDLYTAEDARGRGVARALIGAVSDWARARGCCRVYWATQASNARARRLYDDVAEHRGFILYRLDLPAPDPG